MPSATQMKSAIKAAATRFKAVATRFGAAASRINAAIKRSKVCSVTESTDKLGIERLPVEIIGLVVQFLDAYDMQSCALVGISLVGERARSTGYCDESSQSAMMDLAVLSAEHVTRCGLMVLKHLRNWGRMQVAVRRDIIFYASRASQPSYSAGWKMAVATQMMNSSPQALRAALVYLVDRAVRDADSYPLSDVFLGKLVELYGGESPFSPPHLLAFTKWIARSCDFADFAVMRSLLLQAMMLSSGRVDGVDELARMSARALAQ